MKRLLVFAMLIAVVPARAEQIVLHDGTIVKGELVDFQKGTYTVKVGKFLKNIPESKIVDVRPDGAPGAPAGAGATTSATPGGQLPGAAAIPPPAAGQGRPAGQPPVAQPLYGAGTGPQTPYRLGAAGAALPDLGGAKLSPNQIQDALKKMGGNDPGIMSAVQQMMSGGGIDMGQLQQLQNNPAMHKMVERFRDPAYQRSLLEGLSEIQDKSHPGEKNPMLDQLQGLFQQLNSLQGQQGGGADGR